jgi:hypothetical protein
MKPITFVPTDRRVKNAIIRKICKENEIDNSNFAIYCNENFNYIECDYDIRLSLLKTEYKGILYTFEYFDGCFNAYMVAKVLGYKYEVNNYDHFILYDNDGNKLHTEAGWQINRNSEILFKNYLKTLTKN